MSFASSFFGESTPQALGGIPWRSRREQLAVVFELASAVSKHLWLAIRARHERQELTDEEIATLRSILHDAVGSKEQEDGPDPRKGAFRYFWGVRWRGE